MMKTISKGRFGVIKRFKTKEGTYYEYIARGNRKECMLYIISFAEDLLKLSWSGNVHLSLHVNPNPMCAYLNIIRYNRRQTESLRIEYEISKYTQNNETAKSK